MTTFSVHQWSDPAAGLREIRRVARGPVVILEPALRDRYAEHLRCDLASGAWDARHGHLRDRPYLHGSLVLVRALPA